MARCRCLPSPAGEEDMFPGRLATFGRCGAVRGRVNGVFARKRRKLWFALPLTSRPRRSAACACPCDLGQPSRRSRCPAAWLSRRPQIHQKSICNHGGQGMSSPALTISEIGDFVRHAVISSPLRCSDSSVVAGPACSHTHISGTQRGLLLL